MLHRISTNSGGFSLVEVLLVIVIILMLAGALVVYVLPQQEGAQVNSTVIKLKSIEQALSSYKVNVGRFPNEDEGGLQALLRRPDFEDERLGDKWNGPYIKPGTPLDDAWGNTLRYELVDKTLIDEPDAPDYELFSVGPDGLEETEDDIRVGASVDGDGIDIDTETGNDTAPI